MLIDTHAHLTDEQFDNIRDTLISQLQDNCVEKVFCVAYDAKSIEDVFKLCNKYPNIFGIIGIHPEEVEDFSPQIVETIKKYSQSPKIIGIGEIGLDYHFRQDNKQKQKDIFIQQIKLAHTLHLPISIHNRDSVKDMLDILQENKQFLEYGGVFHCFSESVETYKIIKSLGLKIAFGGTLTFKNSKVAPEVCKVADLEDIILETDCPYLAPTPHRGELNEPKYTSLIAQKIAEIKGISYDKVVEITRNNALKLFPKANIWIFKF